MARTYTFEPEKLIIGVIYSDRDVLEKTLELLVREFGEIDAVSEEYSFSDEFSTYYDTELGGKGIRKIYSFKEPVDPSRQAKIKIFTNNIEKSFNRRINLDPGLISHGRLLLATTKATGFRVALEDGIYSELTLFYARGKWNKLPWTYRDYQTERVQKFLAKVRKIYLEQRKSFKLEPLE